MWSVECARGHAEYDARISLGVQRRAALLRGPVVRACSKACLKRQSCLARSGANHRAVSPAQMPIAKLSR
eukprot:357753-Chlamydomonas_euryale.AAC.5